MARRTLLASLLCGVGLVSARDVTVTKDVTIKSWDGTILHADVHIPKPTSPEERLPVVIFANSWACPEIEYLVQAIKLAEEGFLVLEYESRGWWHSGGLVMGAGPEDQKDTVAIIDYVLAQQDWQPDPQNVALAGISYGAGLALVGAAHDPRVKTAVALSGWADIERAFFDHATPNLVWSEILLQSAKLMGRPDPHLLALWPQLLIGNESAFRDYATPREVITYADKLRARNVPLFISNNFEDRLFQPQHMFEFFDSYTGPKKLLFNQGVHASAEIGGVLDLPHSFVWTEAKKWLTHWLQGKPFDEPQPLVTMQLRSDKRVRETFASWPDARVAQVQYTMTPRSRFGVHGGLVPPASRGQDSQVALADNTLTFGKNTGITAGFPVIGITAQVFIDHRITSNLLASSLFHRNHAIWYYAPLSRTMRLCGTPQLSLDFTASSSKWQIVAYLFSVNGLFDQGTLISHGSVTCWNCTAGQRVTRQIELRTLCDDVTGGLGLALNLYSDLYKPANADRDLTVTFHHSTDFTLTVSEVVAGSQDLSTMLVV